MSHHPAFVMITNVPEQSYELLLQKFNLYMYIRNQNDAATSRDGDVCLSNVPYDFFTGRLCINIRMSRNLRNEMIDVVVKDKLLRKYT
jgi:hypothetical protein